MANDYEELGAFIRQEAERAAKEYLDRVVLAQVAVVADSSVTGFASTRTRTGPNGTQTEVAVWLGDEQTADSVVWLPVRPGLTLADNDVVRVERNSFRSSSAAWWVDAKV